ncbi:serine/threonine-protein kinase [Chondromyces crocatus]|uniref:Protein kinase n=1 Tax=Chondromyces crocatus TaxID=52 RepID=A0A0K1EMZ4_CHOCO|nr:serine/threonine-protein kinase [Chondromyces crocatus]AKT42270.1 protein kinase [Chondromyces crocatus]
MPWPRASADALVGRVLCGTYRVVQLLGSGGVGNVYLAERMGRHPHERLALKVLRAEHTGSPAIVARFEREAEAAARLRHPHVLRVDRLERDGAVLCFAMELLLGLDLADTLTSARALQPARAVRIALEAAGGLGAAHLEGVIHRDVKPENLFLVHAPDGRELVKVLDFGLSLLRNQPSASQAAGRHLKPGAEACSNPPVGTPEYVAPEIVRGGQPSPASDVYALGIVLYEMLAGRAPFVGPTHAILEQHQREPLPPLHRFHPGLLVSRDLDAVVKKALVKDPRARFATMTELSANLLDTPEAREELARVNKPEPTPPARRSSPLGSVIDEPTSPPAATTASSEGSIRVAK